MRPLPRHHVQSNLLRLPIKYDVPMLLQGHAYRFNSERKGAKRQ